MKKLSILTILVFVMASLFAFNAYATNPTESETGSRYTSGTTGPVYQETSDGPITKRTYMVANSGLTAFTTANDLFYVQGSATKTVRVKQVRVTINAATAGVYYLQLQRHAAIGTGNKSADTPQPMDSGNTTAATAVVQHHTAASGAPSTPVVLGSQRFYLAASNASTVTLTWDLSKPNSQPIFLRGATDFLSVSAAGQTITSNGTYDYEVTFEEDNS